MKGQVSPDVVIALVGNKRELLDREVFDAEVNAYAEEEKFVDIVTETSAKTGVGVREVFVDIANVLANKIREVYLYLNQLEPPGSTPILDLYPCIIMYIEIRFGLGFEHRSECVVHTMCHD